MINEVVRPEQIRNGDQIVRGSKSVTVSEEPKTTLMPKEGWPEDPSISPSHWVVYTFTDENGIPYNVREDEKVTRQREETAAEKLGKLRGATARPTGRPRPNPRGYGQ